MEHNDEFLEVPAMFRKRGMITFEQFVKQRTVATTEQIIQSLAARLT